MKVNKKNTYFLLNSKKAFTLVELIIVITILAILATIAFISFQSFTKNARDGNRLATIKQLQNGLEVFSSKTGNYPFPDGNTYTGSINGITYVNKGFVGENISQIIQSSKIPLDPLNNQNYVYGVDINKKQYQLATITEVLNSSKIIQPTYAGNEGSYKSYVIGNYVGFLKYSSGNKTFLANPPSLIWNNTGSVDLLANATYFVINKSFNLPYKPNNDTNISISNGDETIKQFTGNPNAVLTGGLDISLVLNNTPIDIWLKFLSNSGTLIDSFTNSSSKNISEVLNNSYIIGAKKPSLWNFKSSLTEKCCTNWNHSNSTYAIPGVDSLQKCLDWAETNESGNNQVSRAGAPYHQCVRCNGTVDFSSISCSTGYTNFYK